MHGMDATLDSLLRACKDEPFDDVRRLILADWLEEHGDPDRAELVRLQLALSDLWGDEPEAIEREVRRDRLLRANAERWLGPARQWYCHADLERGFVRLQATPRQLLDHPPSDLPADVAPWLEELYLVRETDGREDLLVSSLLGHFSRLELVGETNSARPLLGESALRLLLSNPALGAVRRLRLAWNCIDATCVRMLARCDRLAGLRELDLYTNPLGDAGAVALAEAPWLSGLARLDLGDADLSAAGLAALLRSPHLKALTHLCLSKTTLDEASAQALADSPNLASLTTLSLECAEADDPAVIRALAESPYLRPSVLTLDYLPLGQDGAVALARGRLLERVEKLHLGSNRLTERASATLLSSERLSRLEFLQLWDPIGEAGCEALASAEHLGRLRRASFHDAEVGPEAAAALGRARGLGGLLTLDLNHNPLGPSGLRALCEGGGLPGLLGLSLSETDPQARGLRALVGSGLASRLLRLDLSVNGLTARAAAALGRLSEGRLVELDLNNNRIGPDGADALAGCPALASLLMLALYGNGVKDDGVSALVHSPHLTRLAWLDVRDNRLTSAGGQALLDCPRRGQMTGLLVEDRGLPADLQERISIWTD
jgi:uncharacterized protein (TIGR02996 family)